MTDLELYEYKKKLLHLYKRTRNKRIKWKLNFKIVRAETELDKRGY